MKKINHSLSLVLLIIALLGSSQISRATTYTATTSGNWSAAATWGGSSIGTNITSADAFVIPVGITVSLDNNITINNALASISVAGSLSGSSYDVTVTAGTLTGSGSVTLNTLSIGTSGYLAATGTVSVNQFSNSQLLLSLGSNVTVVNAVTLSSGVVQINSGATVHLSNNATINMAGGTISLNGGAISMAGMYNLSYSGSSSSIGAEASLSGLQNVTVNLSSSGSQISLANDLTVSGTLSLQSGTLALNSHNLTINGTISSSASGSISSSALSNITINGSGNAGTLTFSGSGSTVGNLTVNVSGSSGSVSLGSAATVSGALALNGGSLNISGQNLTISGTVAASGSGNISSSSSSNITINGSGNAGTLTFSGSGSTVGNLTINVSGASGSVSLGSNATVSGALTLSSGSLAINSNTLTLSGTATASGSGTLSGNGSSNLTLSGSGNMGSVSFAASGATLNNLTVNIGSSGTASLSSNLTVNGTLALTSGTLNIVNNLTISGSGNAQGGSASSYVIAAGVGRLTMTVANSGGTGTFQVGTTTSYAPVVITNNSGASGSFDVMAHTGVFANGTSGIDISSTQSVVNTSWDIETSISSGANVNLQVYWNTSMQVNAFDNTQAYVSHFTGGSWNTSALAAATAQGGGTFSLALNGVTSFSPFAVFDKNTATGISDVASNEAFSAYPNPATNVVHISTPEVNTKYDVAIYNMSGQLMMKGQMSDNTLDVSSLNTGIYNIALFENGNIHRTKVAVTR